MAKAIKLLIDGLKSDSVRVRQASAQALRELKAVSDLVGPCMTTALKDKEPSVVSDSLAALASMGPQMVPQFAELLKDPKLQLAATNVLAGFGPNAKAAAPQLIALLDDPQPRPTCPARGAICPRPDRSRRVQGDAPTDPVARR